MLSSRRKAAASGNRSELATQGATNINDGLDLVEQLLSNVLIADDLLGSVAEAFHRACPGQVLPAGNLSYGKDKFM